MSELVQAGSVLADSNEKFTRPAERRRLFLRVAVCALALTYLWKLAMDGLEYVVWTAKLIEPSNWITSTTIVTCLFFAVSLVLGGKVTSPANRQAVQEIEHG